jgi:HlyD family secretion protein
MFGICAAFVEKGGRAELRHVSIGRRNTLEAAVLSGFVEGDRVVLHPSDRVSADVRIAGRNE